ncbi:hypoxanthine phosphoribosyltransferase [Porphyromonas crevioricanis]|uniref:Hypoxanthine phosphoribosyltransferase n=2 Tax=Porphyromonas crevioricanis TaxID=393921 RepID=A0A0A2G0Z7_9PORP|nr:phosphoribosyltransferase family protein [Porphyromonas crevioricanis]KGN90447.1 hypoxanthine phosphoribosyltransferase [Porphyromonas crevioricanis]KGN96901.1 hypoxanthine phosphoribosyltransferase [Porphyromonas crevioricanis]SJZ91927.1 hypoxanthine phosphoribosyltransferase [Porphyromonas crevioricanis]SQH73800.1 Hypoxanthine-guanine phosphoribosyltransferase [Porphyromonas crevioricanis]GAD05967.1 hypoxanthine-guanine phosphoribosyltransferase [Porphyromonas crevioricanis JCM 15906]
MKEIRLKDKVFELYISSEEINKALDRMAEDIRRDLGDQNPLFVCIMNGSFMFASELMQRLNDGYEVAFARYSSYSGTSSTFELKEVMPVTQSLEGRTVVILEDLIDTGFTMMNVKRRFYELGAKQVVIAAMLCKPDAKKCDVETDYIGLNIANEFIVGHGLDYDDLGRMYNDIYKIKE